MDNDCEGCYTSSSFPDCFYSKIEGCPCKICLIKMICEHPCEYLDIHLGHVNKLYDVNREIP